MLCFPEMAERHDVQNILMIARELVHKVQSMMDNKWPAPDCPALQSWSRPAPPQRPPGGPSDPRFLLCGTGPCCSLDVYRTLPVNALVWLCLHARDHTVKYPLNPPHLLFSTWVFLRTRGGHQSAKVSLSHGFTRDQKDCANYLWSWVFSTKSMCVFQPRKPLICLLSVFHYDTNVAFKCKPEVRCCTFRWEFPSRCRWRPEQCQEKARGATKGWGKGLQPTSLSHNLGFLK